MAGKIKAPTTYVYEENLLIVRYFIALSMYINIFPGQSINGIGSKATLFLMLHLRLYKTQHTMIFTVYCADIELRQINAEKKVIWIWDCSEDWAPILHSILWKVIRTDLAYSNKLSNLDKIHIIFTYFEFFIHFYRKTGNV